jgi:hypothetical protein
MLKEKVQHHRKLTNILKDHHMLFNMLTYMLKDHRMLILTNSRENRDNRR